MSSSAPPDNASSANGKHIQKKLLNYARDFALEKLNKTLDKKLSKRRGGEEDDDNDDDDGDDAREIVHSTSRRSARRSAAVVSHIVVQRRHPDDDDDGESSTAVERHRHRRQHRHNSTASTAKGRASGRRGGARTTTTTMRRRTAGDSSDDVEDNSDDDDVRRVGRANVSDDGDDDVTTELVEVRTRRRHHPHSHRQPSPGDQRRHSSSSSHLHPQRHRHSERKSSSGAAAGGETIPKSRKTSLASLSRPRSTAPQPPGFPVSNAHLMLPPAVEKGDRRRGLSRAVRKSMYADEDDDDDEFHTATDADDDDNEDCSLVTSEGSESTEGSDSEITVLMPTRPAALKGTAGLQRASASVSGSARNSSQKRTSSSNHYDAVELRPRPLNRPQKAAHLAINMPEFSTDKIRHDGKDGKLQTPVGSPGFNAQGHQTTTADYSGYIQKKSLAQGMMDLALLSANINQMRYLLEYKDNQPYFATSFTLVITSLLLQIGVSLTLIWNIRFNVKKSNEMKEADRVNNMGVMGIFLVTVINVALSTFGGAPAPKEIHIGGEVGGGAGVGGLMPDMDGAGSGDADPMIFT